MLYRNLTTAILVSLAVFLSIAVPVGCYGDDDAPEPNAATATGRITATVDGRTMTTDIVTALLAAPITDTDSPFVGKRTLSIAGVTPAMVEGEGIFILAYLDGGLSAGDVVRCQGDIPDIFSTCPLPSMGIAFPDSANEDDAYVCVDDFTLTITSGSATNGAILEGTVEGTAYYSEDGDFSEEKFPITDATFGVQLLVQ